MLDTFKDLWGKYFGETKGKPQKVYTTKPPATKGWLEEVWGGLKTVPAKARPRHTGPPAMRYDQIQRSQKMRRRAQDGPKYRRYKGSGLTNATSN